MKSRFIVLVVGGLLAFHFLVMDLNIFWANEYFSL